MAIDTVKNTIKVALGVCLVCSILVTGAVTALKILQEKNKHIDKMKNILAAAGLETTGTDIEEIYNERIYASLIDLESGEFLSKTEDPALNAKTYDIRKALKSDTYSSLIPSDKDIARIHRKPKYMPVYMVKKAGFSQQEQFQVESLILPFYGKGLWSTMYGFIALEGEKLEKVSGLTFYEHGETPGLGGEVDNPKWKMQWKGKQALDSEGQVLIEVIKGTVDPQDSQAAQKVDGLSGATMTTRGVNHMIHFWLGAEGYARFLRKIKKGLV